MHFCGSPPNSCCSFLFLRPPNALIKAFEDERNKGFSFNRLFPIIKRFIEKKPKMHFCYGCGEMLAIMPNGDISLCHRLGINGITIISNVASNDPMKDIINSELYNKLLNRSPFNIPECSNCECIGICGGGCYLNAYEKRGNFFKNDPEYCSFIKAILNWIIHRILRDSKL